MMNFAELNAHEKEMLDLWLEFWAEGMEGAFDDRDEDFGFEEWLAESAEWFAEECGEEYAEPYRQALAEWQA